MRRGETYRPAARDAARRAMRIARLAGAPTNWRAVWADALAARAKRQPRRRERALAKAP